MRVSGGVALAALKSIGAYSPSIDGHGAAASFNEPVGLALDAAGNIYVAESNGGRIRKMTPAGYVTTFAGSGGRSQRTVDGHGIAAEFKEPMAVAADAAGNLYVTEFFDSAIRKITPAGDVTTLPVSLNAGFDKASGIAVDVAGNIYVADTGNHRIRKITPSGEVTTLAGSGQVGASDGLGSAASFNKPKGLALDSDGNLFVADRENHLLRKITPAGWVTTIAGQPGVEGATNGSGAAASFAQPWGVAVGADGAVYVADYGNNQIRKITPIQVP